MKLYHATLTENIESIEDNGIIPNATSAIPGVGCKQIERTGIFGFINIDSAISFACDNDGKWSIVSFDSCDYETEIDPEYEGEALFIETTDSISIIAIEETL